MAGLTKEQIDAWNKRNQSAFQGLLNVNQFVPVTGDIQSGVMAAQDVKKGNYGSAALNAVGLLPFIPALGGITAWHGSPATFEKFDLGKIGSGAGNEYYGRGVYFTESPELAKSYQSGKELDAGDIFVKNKKIAPKSIEEELALQGVRGHAFYDVGKDPIDAALDSFRRGLGTYTDEARNIKNQKAFDYLTKLKEKNASFVPGGSLYKVDIPDESIPKMLDFEKPLYKQSDEVKKLAMEYAPALKNRLEFTGGDSIWNLTGSDLFGAMQRYNPGESNTVKGITSESISNMLLSKGVPGSKYMDTGAGAKNYVVFDPNTVKILERNGLLLP